MSCLTRKILSLLLLLSLAAPCSAAPPATTRTTAPAITTAPAPKDVQRLALLTRRGVEALEKKKYSEAEVALTEAIAIDPNHPTNLYNMACLHAQLGQSDEAITFLDRAASAGFVDFSLLEADPDLEPLHKLPKYKAIIARKEAYQRQVAQSVVDMLKRQFGNDYLYEVDEADKLIFATNTDKDTLAAMKKDLVMQAHSQWKQLFAHKPEQYITIVLPSVSDYKKIVKMPGVGGFYNHEARTLVMQRLGQVMTHEFTHAMHAADLDPTGQEHPIWLIEGMAVMYEAATFENDQLVPHDNFRLPYMQLAGRSRHLIGLERLMRMKQKEFVQSNNATLTYGESGSILLYLQEQNLLRKYYDTVKVNYARDATGRLALEQVTGKKLADFEADWQAWMLKRTPPPMAAGRNGTFLGVRFAQANDGLRVDEIVPASPAAKAGAKVGDVVVGLDDIEVRDYQSMMPLLLSRSPGDAVTLRVRRDNAYIDLPVTLSRRNGNWAPK